MRMFRLWCMALCLVFAEASFASAHRVNIFAFVDGDAVQVECGFNRSQKVKQGTVVPVAALHRSSLPVFHPIGA